MVVCQERSIVSKHKLSYQNICGFFLCGLKLTGIDQVCPRSTQYPYSLDGISESIKQDKKEKSKVCVSPRSQPQIVLRVPPLN